MAPDGLILDAGWSAATRCPRPARGVAFLLGDGRYAPVGCGRVSCPGCGKRHALAALEMVRDTSARMGNPECAATLTSVDPDTDTSARWSRDVEQVIKALRRRWSGVQYLAFMEWTTGRGRRSGGRRRPHSHLLLRGLPRDQAPLAESTVRRVWEQRTGAHRVEVAPLVAAENGVAYLALHHLKPNQAAPEGWTGRRLRPSKGWWGTDPKQLRDASERLVAERAHRDRERQLRRAEVDRLVEAGCDPKDAADAIYGPDDAPLALPPRQPAQVVRLRKLA
jgi:hypothetical protein